MKGSAEITLTDVVTGEEQRFREDNLVTNAVQDLIRMNPAGLNSKGIPFGLPICPNAIGGVLLFPDTIEEDAAKYYAPVNLLPTGYASNSADTTADPKRGSYNANESYRTENGYRLVFDFGTSDANGEIKSVCLTSSQGGRAYFGSQYLSEPNWCYELFTGYWEANSVDNALYKTIGALDGEHVYACRNVDGSNIEWGQWVKHVNDLQLGQGNGLYLASLQKTSVYLKFSYDASGYDTPGYDDHSYHDRTSVSFNNRAGSCFDGCAYWRWYWVAHSAGTDIKLCKVEDGKATEWTMNYAGVALSGAAFATIANGYIYSWDSAGDGVYKLSTTDPTDVTHIPVPEGTGKGSTIWAITSPFSDGRLYVVWRYTVGSVSVNYAAILHDDVMERTYHYDFEWNRNQVSCTQNRGKRFGPYFLQPYYAKAGNYNYGWRLSVIAPYLATINNLSSPITKTVTQTMKVVYTLTEV